jgi:hypothetical protein
MKFWDAVEFGMGFATGVLIIELIIGFLVVMVSLLLFRSIPFYGG